MAIPHFKPLLIAARSVPSATVSSVARFDMKRQSHFRSRRSLSSCGQIYLIFFSFYVFFRILFRSACVASSCVQYNPSGGQNQQRVRCLTEKANYKMIAECNT